MLLHNKWIAEIRVPSKEVEERPAEQRKYSANNYFVRIQTNPSLLTGQKFFLGIKWLFEFQIFIPSWYIIRSTYLEFFSFRPSVLNLDLRRRNGICSLLLWKSEERYVLEKNIINIPLIRKKGDIRTFFSVFFFLHRRGIFAQDKNFMNGIVNNTSELLQGGYWFQK